MLVVVGISFAACVRKFFSRSLSVLFLFDIGNKSDALFGMLIADYASSFEVVFCWMFMITLSAGETLYAHLTLEILLLKNLDLFISESQFG